jgi:hypothetical protein
MKQKHVLMSLSLLALALIVAISGCKKDDEPKDLELWQAWFRELLTSMMLYQQPVCRYCHLL